MPYSLYVASSWKNPLYEIVCARLRLYNFNILDWRKSGKGFTWDQVHITSNDEVESATYRRIITEHPKARAGFNSDFDMMQAADMGVLLLPCGKSAHLEAGWFWGRKQLHILTYEKVMQPELMYLGAKSINFSVHALAESILNKPLNMKYEETK